MFGRLNYAYAQGSDDQVSNTRRITVSSRLTHAM